MKVLVTGAWLWQFGRRRAPVAARPIPKGGREEAVAGCFFPLTPGGPITIKPPTGIPARRRGFSVCQQPQCTVGGPFPEGCPSG